MNFKFDCWFVGNLEMGYLNCDGSFIKFVILYSRWYDGENFYWDFFFGKWLDEELYYIVEDKDCI